MIDLQHRSNTSVPFDIVERVRAQYEQFPYPRYPLLAKPFWQDGVGGSSLFSRTLMHKNHLLFATGQDTLILGCGDMQPYIFSCLEPKGARVFGIDLSRSSIKRANFRLKANFRKAYLMVGDLDSYLVSGSPYNFSHIDAFGVLHHLVNPGQTIAAIYERLAPGGTLRVMIYNAKARSWIREIAKIFCLLGYDYRYKQDLRQARQLLVLAKKHYHLLAQHLASMGKSLLTNDSRFIDAFFHEREVHLSYTSWLSHFAKTGFLHLGFFDRYGELDHLANPLWQPPASATMEALIDQGLFRGNFELYFAKPGGEKQAGSSRLFASLRPPRLWFTFPETASLSWPKQLFIWQKYQKRLSSFCIDDPKSFPPMPLASWQRLARLGAVMPGEGTWQDKLLAPIAKEAPLYESPVKTKTVSDDLRVFIENRLQKLAITTLERRRDLIFARLSRL